MTRGSSGIHDEKERIAVTIKLHGTHALDIAALLALVPEFTPAAAPEDSLSACQCAVQALGIHPGQHEHTPAGGILHNRGNEPLRVKRNSSLKRICTNVFVVHGCHDLWDVRRTLMPLDFTLKWRLRMHRISVAHQPRAMTPGIRQRKRAQRIQPVRCRTRRAGGGRPLLDSAPGAIA